VGEGLPDGAGGGPVVLAAGSRVAGYVLEEEVGAGGMAVVFRARDERLDRLVALKVLAPGLAADGEFRRRFLRESRAAAAVDDPHIIPVYEAGQAGGVLFIAMRYVSGGDVRGLLRREGVLSAGRAAAIVSPVAAALDAAHGAGLVHRDVKPGNMLIDARPGRPDHVYLSDFGLAKGGSASVLTGTGVGLGTVAYMAPEQIQGPGVVDGRADQYALGCAAFELLGGTVPFERDQDMAVLYAHLSVPPPSLASRRPGLPAGVDAVLGRALAKAPGDRYASCGEFAEALRTALGLPGYDRELEAVAARAAVAPGPAPHAPTVADAGATVIDPTQAGSGAAAGGRAGPAGAGAGGGAAAIRTLPRDIASFTGRQRELEDLVEAAVAGAGGVVGIHAIGGMAGVGKTAFAVHAAHQLADRFPAGQIFLPLHGHTPGRRPVDPGDALASLLATAGVPARQIPEGTEARMGLWRDRLAEKQLLLVLDDAASSEQVFPLLPGAGASLVLVTSRRHLSALEDATAVSLDTLPPGEAAGLLVRLASRPGLGPQDAAVAELTRLCGYLPLAIGMVARQLHHHPAWTAAGRAAELAAAVDRLELMATENLSVAAAFDLSYADLTPDQQRLFRRLGLHPGAEIDGYAAAALDGTNLAAACRGLEVLYDQYLLAEPAAGRYRMHDLIRAHARALAGRLDPDDNRDRATARLLDYYQHTAARADALIARQGRPSPGPADGTFPAAVPDLAGPEQALAWVRAEQASLVACLDQATATGQHARVIGLTAGLAGLLRHDGPWAQAITRHTAAVQAARQLGDRLGQANALNDLGVVRRLTDEYPAAAQVLEQALGIYRDLGDRLGQANALKELGVVRRLTDEYPAAAQVLEQALGIYRDLGDRPGQADALCFLGVVRRATGDFPAAAEMLEQALGIYRDLGDRHGQANALLFLGTARRLTGDFPAAARVLEQALGIYRDLGDRLGQANTCVSLGTVRQLTGDYLGATEALEQGLDIFRDLGSRHGQANALALLGAVRRATGDYLAAAQMLEQALDVWRDLGDRGSEAEALNERGTLHRVSGNLAQAEECHRQALELARVIASAWDQADALAGLGRCAQAAGRTTDARDHLRQALEIFQRIGAAEATQVSAELDALAQPRPRAHPHGRAPLPPAARWPGRRRSSKDQDPVTGSPSTCRTAEQTCHARRCRGRSSDYAPCKVQRTHIP
jgi:tetratricopeptide (TPR) repeat protein